MRINFVVSRSKHCYILRNLLEVLRAQKWKRITYKVLHCLQEDITDQTSE